MTALNATKYRNNYRTVTGTPTIYKDDEVLNCNTASAAVIINLLEIPDNYWSTTWKLYIRDSGNNAATNNITINAGSGQTINGASSYTINTNGGYVIVQVAGDGQYVVTSSNQAGGSTPFSGTNWSFVYGNGTHAANATALQAAYTAAKAATPNGLALSATNRFTIMVGAGYYTFSSNLVLDTQFIDIVSITGNADVIFNGSATISITADDVYVKGIDVTTKNFTIATALASLVLENCVGGQNSFGGGVGAAGNFINCTGGEFSFGGNVGGLASGNFTNCTGGTSSFGGFGGEANGTFINCTGGQYSFGGGGGTANGTFTDCLSYNYSFGGGGDGLASGTFTRCKGSTDSFGGGINGVASGTFIDCEGGAGAFAGGDDGGNTASGIFRNCIAAENSFGGGDNNGGVASGTFTNCIGANGSFGGGDSGLASGAFVNCVGGDESFGNLNCTGSFNNCQGGTESFGGHTGGALTGKLYWCKLTSGTFRTVSGGGRTMYCIDGNNATNNQ